MSTAGNYLAELRTADLAPLFRVFWCPKDDGWGVCGVNSDGEPILIHKVYQSLQVANDEAARLNQWAVAPEPKAEPKKVTRVGRLVRWFKERTCHQ